MVASVTKNILMMVDTKITVNNHRCQCTGKSLHYQEWIIYTLLLNGIVPVYQLQSWEHSCWAWEGLASDIENTRFLPLLKHVMLSWFPIRADCSMAAENVSLKTNFDKRIKLYNSFLSWLQLSDIKSSTECKFRY